MNQKCNIQDPGKLAQMLNFWKFSENLEKKTLQIASKTKEINRKEGKNPKIFACGELGSKREFQK